jgi:hypothetical protein
LWNAAKSRAGCGDPSENPAKSARLFAQSAVNEAFREDAEPSLKPQARKLLIYTHPVDTGMARILLDDIPAAFAFAEGEDYK